MNFVLNHTVIVLIIHFNSCSNIVHSFHCDNHWKEHPKGNVLFFYEIYCSRFLWGFIVDFLFNFHHSFVRSMWLVQEWLYFIKVILWIRTSKVSIQSRFIAYSYGCWKGHLKLLNWFREEFRGHDFWATFSIINKG